MKWLKGKVRDWLEIVPVGGEFGVSVLSDADFEREIFRNKVWYRGVCSELAGFYGSVDDLVGNRSFWAEGGRNHKIRKMHSGLPAMMVDVLADITLGDFLGVRVNSVATAERFFHPKGEKSFPMDANEELGIRDEELRWQRVASENGFGALLARAVRTSLALGDGAFRVSFDDGVSGLPIIEFFGGDRVRFNYLRGRISEVVFLHDGFEEIYHKDGIRYVALGEDTPVPADVLHGLGVILAVPLIFDENPRFAGRGKSVFDGKIHAFDALDEVISQWVDALRDGRVQKYVPSQMLPRDPRTGEVRGLGGFESRFVQTQMDLAEGADNSVKVVQPLIDTDALEASFAGFLNLALQGVLAPATLGMDLKRGDNATAQREREKATLYTRGRIIDGLRGVLATLVKVVLVALDAANGEEVRDYKVAVEFGEYAAPDFGSQIEVVAKGVTAGVMSFETAVEQLYGDTWTQEQKADEVARLMR
ncbi:MAG: capsid protein [Defluviitaleaceae bacterium]|nr:capsid protein [Defluviitaleaceae bacterium]